MAEIVPVDVGKTSGASFSRATCRTRCWSAWKVMHPRRSWPHLANDLKNEWPMFYLRLWCTWECMMSGLCMILLVWTVLWLAMHSRCSSSGLLPTSLKHNTCSLRASAHAGSHSVFLVMRPTGRGCACLGLEVVILTTLSNRNTNQILTIIRTMRSVNLVSILLTINLNLVVVGLTTD